MYTGMRPDWDSVWMTTAQAIGSRSLCSRAQVGAVIVSADNRVQSSSYNGPPPGFPHLEKPCTDWCARSQAGASTDSSYANCESTHAETSALVRADWSQLEGGSIYVTGAVCITCARLICHTGIARVLHVVHTTDAHRDPVKVEAFLRSFGRQVIRLHAVV